MSIITQASLKERLKNLAEEKNITFTALFKRLCLERFLVRLSKSDFSNKFIFKGGCLLSYYLNIGRETKDLDFLIMKIQAEEAHLQKAFQKICSIDVGDGLEIRFVQMKTLRQNHTAYPGLRVKLKIEHQEGGMRDNLQIDLGIGDEVNPETQTITLLKYRSKPFFEDSVSLKVYPPEEIFAEKLETVISKAGLNSRMKDYHDLILMGRKAGLLRPNALKNAIDTTFKHRGTEKQFPIRFQNDDYARLEGHWNHHLRGLGGLAKDLKLPENFRRVISELNQSILNMGLKNS